jgi:hypothetical protein
LLLEIPVGLELGVFDFLFLSTVPGKDFIFYYIRERLLPIFYLVCVGLRFEGGGTGGGFFYDWDEFNEDCLLFSVVDDTFFISDFCVFWRLDEIWFCVFCWFEGWSILDKPP